MSDRLAELRRQRALLQQHADWLEREIADEQRKAKAPHGLNPAVAAARGTRPASHPAEAAVPLHDQAGGLSTRMPALEFETAGGTAVDPLMEQYRVPTASLKNDVRKGCFLYFAAALLAVVALIALLYFTIGSR
jgi:hypothetical protein